MSNNKQPLDLTDSDADKSDEKTIDFLLDRAKRGENLDNHPPPSICKVSRILRDHSVRSFIPQLVSIGPIHREDRKLQEFERQKERYLNNLLNRCDSTPKKTLEACLQKIKKKIPQIRESYAGVINNYSDVDLARMMVMDGCFILEFCFKHENEDKDLPKEMQNLRIAMDLMLLENQVPFSVLQALFDCSMGKQYSFTLSDVLDDYLAPYIQLFRSDLFSTTDVDSDSPKKISTTDVDSDSTPDHILGYLHNRYQLVAAKSSKPKLAKVSKKPRFFLNAPSPKKLYSSFCIIFRKCTWSNCVMALPLHAEASKHVDEELAAKSSNPIHADAEASKPVNEERIENTANHSIVELDRSGVNFKPHQEDEWSMTIKFQSSVFAWLPFFWKPTLLMPTLVIEDFTELILRNFIAYEQSFPQDHDYFTSYAHAMDMLIDTQEDIAKLVESKVLVNRLGSNQEAADMIYEICKNVLVKKFCYTEEFKQMDEYYNGYWPKNIAWLRRVYFTDPWSGTKLILFILAVVQTFYTIIGK